MCVDLGGRRIIKKKKLIFFFFFFFFFLFFFVFFFFKQKTAYEIHSGDWSSDVCSSDLASVDRHYITLQVLGVIVMGEAGVPGVFTPTPTIAPFSS